MIKLFLFSFITLNIYANNILKIEENFEVHDSKNIIYYIEDEKNIFTKEDILLSKDLKVAIRTQIPSSKGPFWTRLEIQNTTNQIQNLSIYNSLAGTNEVDVYIYKDSVLIKTHLLGDLRDQKQREIISRHAMFPLSLGANEKVVLVSKIKSYYLHNIGWVVEKNSLYLKEEFNKLFIFGILFGITSLFVLYNILSFKIFNEIAFLILATNSIIATMYVYGFNGILYQLNIGLNLHLITAITWNISNIGAIMLILFPYYFFNVKKNYPKLNYYLKFKILVFIIITLITLYAQFFNEDYFIATTILVLTIINAFSLLTIGIYMYIKKELGSNYYLFGQGILMISMIIHVLNILNIITYSEVNKYIYLIGLVFDLIYLTIAQHIKTKNRVEVLEKTKKLLLEQSHFASIGHAIGHITHQWKHPLTSLGTSITLLEAISLHKKEDLLKSFKNKLPSINNDIEYMNNILIEFCSFYSSKEKKTTFDLEKSVENIKRIINSKIILKNVQIQTNFDEIKTIYNFEHIFSNIILILIDNSIDAFKANTGNKIFITMKKTKSHYQLLFKDNAGGIQIHPINKIFEYNVSSKENSENMGMGTPILKMLVEDKLKGTIHVENIDEGSCFSIALPLE